MTSFFQKFRQSAVSALDAILPPLCVLCEHMVSDSHGFCGTCWRDFTFIAPPMCACCGLPFEYDGQGLSDRDDDRIVCGQCLTEKPTFAIARSALVYNEASKKIILPFKHHDRTDYSRAIARMMQNTGHDMISRADILLPVPLHFFRLFSRRYNQAALLVHDLGRLCKKPVLLDGLVRKRATQSQGHLSKKQREKNVQNAFVVAARAIETIRHKNLLLIDDVLTTGATANACVTALLKAGAARVELLTLARVVKIDM